MAIKTIDLLKAGADSIVDVVKDNGSTDATRTQGDRLQQLLVDMVDSLNNNIADTPLDISGIDDNYIIVYDLGAEEFVVVELTSASLSDAATIVHSDEVAERSAQEYFTPNALIDAPNISWDLDDYQNASVVITDNRTLGNPTNINAGGRYLIDVVQDAGGGNTLSFDTAYKFSGGFPVSINTTGDIHNILEFYSPDGVNMVLIKSTVNVAL